MQTTWHPVGLPWYSHLCGWDVTPKPAILNSRGWRLPTKEPITTLANFPQPEGKAPSAGVTATWNVSGMLRAYKCSTPQKSWNTVDGRNPANQLIGSLSHHLQGFMHPRWLFGISSINSISQITKLTSIVGLRFEFHKFTAAIWKGVLRKRNEMRTRTSTSNNKLIR